MTPLRNKMIRELELHREAPGTIKQYAIYLGTDDPTALINRARTLCPRAHAQSWPPARSNLMDNGDNATRSAQTLEYKVLERERGVDTSGKQQLDGIVNDFDWSFRHDDNVRVAQPNLVGRTWTLAEQRVMNFDVSGHELPAVVAPEDNHMVQVAANIPTTGQCNRLHNGRRSD